MKRFLAFASALLMPAMVWGQANSYMNFATGSAPSYEGLWSNAKEPGWGVSVSHQADIIFAVWYTHDHDGSPMWLVMPDAALVDTSMNDSMGMMEMSMMGMMQDPPIYTGVLYRTRGPAFSNATFDRNAVGVTAVGMGTLLFRNHGEGVFAYTVDSFSGSKDITRMSFSSSAQSCSVGGAQKASKPNYQDLWGRASESGWGVNIAHQGDTLFATWFTYDAAGKAMWLVMPNATKNGDAQYAGRVYRSTGPAYDSANWDTSRVQATDVGSATFAFNSGSSGSFSFAVEGVTQMKQIDRMVFALPVSVCN